MIQQNTIRFLLKKMIITLGILIIGTLLFERNLSSFLIVSGSCLLINSHFTWRTIRKGYRVLLEQFERYLSDVRHHYQKSEMVEEAVYEAIWSCEFQIGLHIQVLYQVLVSEDAEELEEYKQNIPFPYLLTFFILCKSIMTYGDTIFESKSLFLSNLNQLKEEVYNEILKRDRLSHVFSGLFLVALIPVFFLDYIKGWSILNLPELIRYYDTSYGIIMKSIICAISVFVFQLLHYLIEPIPLLPCKHIWLDRLNNIAPMKKILMLWIHVTKDKCKEYQRLLKRIKSDYTLLHFLQLKMLFSVSAFLFVTLVNIDIILNTNRIDKVTLPFEIGTKGYQLVENTSYSSIHLIVTFVIATLSFQFPNLLLRIKSSLLKRTMEDEVIQYQAVLIMLVHIRRMTIEVLLEWLEKTSRIFREPIMDCINQYNHDNEYALEQLKQKESFLPFIRIIENLEVCDRIGIEKAFDELVSERNFFIEKRKQDNEIYITNQGVIGKVAAFTPFVLTIAGYLIIPFVLESMAQFMSYVKDLQGFSY